MRLLQTLGTYLQAGYYRAAYEGVLGLRRYRNALGVTPRPMPAALTSPPPGLMERIRDLFSLARAARRFK